MREKAKRKIVTKRKKISAAANIPYML